MNLTMLKSKKYSKEIREIINRAYDEELIKKASWSKICSCMDWLDVTINTLERPKFLNSYDKDSMSFIHFVVHIDILIESIENLWRATEHGIGIQKFKFNSKEIFQSIEYGREHTDKEHFKLIRAWFGIHGTNGNEVELPGYQKKVRFFSSWSYTNDGEKYSLILYSNDSEAEQKYGLSKEIKVNELIKFAEYFYSSLEILIERIKEKLPLEVEETFEYTEETIEDGEEG